jgi:hypothetical protein
MGLFPSPAIKTVPVTGGIMVFFSFTLSARLPVRCRCLILKIRNRASRSYGPPGEKTQIQVAGQRFYCRGRPVTTPCIVPDTFRSKPFALIQTGPFPQERMERANPKASRQKDFLKCGLRGYLKKPIRSFGRRVPTKPGQSI